MSSVFRSVQTGLPSSEGGDLQNVNDNDLQMFTATHVYELSFPKALVVLDLLAFDNL